MHIARNGALAVAWLHPLVILKTAGSALSDEMHWLGESA